MTFIIEKNVPIPASRSGTRASKYPFAGMDVGDSFFAPDVKLDSMRNTAGAAGRRLGMKFRCAAEDDDEMEGTRCWRVA